MSVTPSLRWEWTLANGARVAAEIDKQQGRELVLVGGRIASEAPRGTKPDGHAVVVPPAPGTRNPEPLTAVASFEPSSPICILRVDGQEVNPTAWPVPQRRVPQPDDDHPVMRWLIYAAVGVAVIGIGITIATRTGGAPPEQPLSSTQRATNGLFIAHYPATYRSKPVVLPTPLAGSLLEDDTAHTAVVLAAFELEASTAPDRWLLQQRFHDEVLANLPKTARSYAEVDRRDDKCLGETGAVIIGRYERPEGSKARVWSCAFVKDRRGYVVAYALPDKDPDAPLRRIVDGTELTQLESVGTPP
jgi:hypothetical protein